MSHITSDLTLIEKKTITTGTTTVTFSSLDGDADEVYLLIGRIKNGTGSDSDYFLRPNGISTNQETTELAWFPFSTVVGVNANLILLFLEASNIGSYTMTFHAKRSSNSVAMSRLFTGQFTEHDVAGVSAVGEMTAGFWNETSTNVTSLDIVATTASAIGDGSELLLYKVAQA